MFTEFGQMVICFYKSDKYVGKNGVAVYNSEADAENAIQVISQLRNEDGERMLVFTYEGKQ